MSAHLDQETILECAVYSMIGLCFSKFMIAVGAETGSEGTVGHGPNRDTDPHTHSLEAAWTAGQSSELVSWDDYEPPSIRGSEASFSSKG